MEIAAITLHCIFVNLSYGNGKVFPLPDIDQSVTELDLDFPQAEAKDWSRNSGMEQGVKLAGGGNSVKQLQL